MVFNHVTNGGNMKRFRYLLFSMLFVLLAVMPPVFAQEEAAVEEEAVVEEAAVEEEAVWGDDAATEEVAPAETAKATGSGMTISAGYGMGLAHGEYITSSSGMGLVVGLPVSIPIGPLDVSVSAAILANTMDAGPETGASITQIMVFGMANPPGMPIVLMGGAGMAGSGLAVAGGLGVPVNAFVPDLPVNVMVGVNANILTAIDDNIEGNTGYVAGFLMLGTSF